MQLGFGKTSIGNETTATGGVGQVLVTGAGSVWSNGGGLVVGNASAGNTLTIGNGGAVYDGGGYLGYTAGASNNAALVTVTGSVWSNSGTLNVGYSSAGNTLTIGNGGAVNDSIGYLGCNVGASNNAVLVMGAGSVWSNSGALYVGWNGKGNTLTISNGGVVYSSSYCYLGVFSGANSNTVLVTGAGSVWSNSGALYVGGSGNSNTLTLANGGTAVATNVVIGSAATTGNVLNVAGGNLVVTNAAGTGTLEIRYGTLAFTGGTINANALMMTNNAGAANAAFNFVAGTLTTSTNSTLQTPLNQDFVIGSGTAAGQTGVWNIAGGVVQMQLGIGKTSIGNESTGTGGVGQVTVTGSVWSNSGTLNVGYSGAGNSLIITNGGLVSAPAVILGANAGSSNNTLFMAGSSSGLIVTNAGAGVVDIRRGLGTLAGGTLRANTLLLTNGMQGAFTLSAGTLAVNNLMNNGSANLAASGGTLQPLNGNGNWSAALVLSNTVTLNTMDAGGLARTNVLAGVLSGPGGLTVVGSGALNLAGNNTFSGGLIISNGLVSISTAANLGNGLVGVYGGLGTLQILGTTLTNLNDRNVDWANYNGFFDINDAADVFTLTNQVAGTLTKTGAGQLVLTGGASGQVTNSSGGTLVVGNVNQLTTMANNGTVQFTAGSAGTSSGTISGTGSNLFTLGTGNRLNLIGDSSAFQGTNVVTSGNLAVNGSLGGLTEVASNALLSGIGSLSHVEIQNGGLLSPGNSPGTNYIGNLTLDAGAILTNEIFSLATHDMVVATNLTVNGLVTWNLTLTGIALPYTNIITLIDVGTYAEGSLTTNWLSLDGSTRLVEGESFLLHSTDSSNNFFRISYLGGDGNDVTLTAIPEPVDVLLLFCSGGGLYLYRRIRSKTGPWTFGRIRTAPSKGAGRSEIMVSLGTMNTSRKGAGSNIYCTRTAILEKYNFSSGSRRYRSRR